MLKRAVFGKKFTWFLVCLIVVYIIVWIYAFNRQPNYYDRDRAEDVRRLDKKCLCNLTGVVPVRVKGDVDDVRVARCNDTNCDVMLAASNPTHSGHGVPRYKQYAVKPFTPNQPKLVVLFGYQRVGSSFFGKIFDLNPDTFYVYEPLDSMYQAMYGTGSGFSVPSDITSFKNGTDRELPADEILAASKFLSDLFHCHLNRLPTEFFVHSFWSLLPMFMPSWRPYLNCLHNASLVNGRKRCSGSIKCPKRFGQNLEKSAICRQYLWHSLDVTTGARSPWATKYKQCMDQVRREAKTCIMIVDGKCQSHSLRVIKTVRATMNSIEDLIQNEQNVRIIHLIRDPRPVAVSRMGTVTYHGLFARNDTIREAKLYCSAVTRDLRVRRRLELDNPGTFYEVIYDDFVQRPADYVAEVYRFLDEQIPDKLLSWIGNSTHERKSGSVPIWKRTLTVEQSENIRSVCKQFYDMVYHQFE